MANVFMLKLRQGVNPGKVEEFEKKFKAFPKLECFGK